jgi:beta-N-acetylhexosaminidase
MLWKSAMAGFAVIFVAAGISARAGGSAAAVSATGAGAVVKTRNRFMAGERRGGIQTRRDPASPRAAHRPLEQRLSNAQLAGQRIVYAYAGLTPPRSLLAQIRAGEAAGVIFFSPNISSSAQLRAVISELQDANQSSLVRAPLLMMLDQEGGLVRRLPGAPALSEKQIGESAQPVALAERAGTGAGENLRAAAVNVNLAPVLDVYRQAGNFIDQYQRSYSSNPAAVAQLGAAFIDSQQKLAVAATAKHFPGLGDATSGQDTDAAPVTLNLSLATLRTIDEAPYRSAIAAGVKLVMVSWATYPALDPHLPAGLSSRVIDGELRGRRGFRGVTITDGLGAGALASFGGFAQRGLLAAHAGADLLLCATTNPNDNTPANGIAVLNALSRALANHTLQRSYAEQAVARIVSLRSNP